jgi:hypothetical protein
MFMPFAIAQAASQERARCYLEQMVDTRNTQVMQQFCFLLIPRQFAVLREQLRVFSCDQRDDILGFNTKKRKKRSSQQISPIDLGGTKFTNSP